MTLENMIFYKIVIICIYALSWYISANLFDKDIVINGIYGVIIASTLMTANEKTLYVYMSIWSYFVAFIIIFSIIRMSFFNNYKKGDSNDSIHDENTKR